MAIYAIGSINGNYEALKELLDTIEFDKQQDTLWFSGNLIGENENNHSVLHFVKQLGRSAFAVLGEEELNLLALSCGFKPEQATHSYDAILSSPEHTEILTWLSQWSLFHFDRKLNCAMVHAGIPPTWSLSQISTFAIEAETALSTNYQAYFDNIAKQPLRRWNAKLQGWKRLQFIISAFTRLKRTTEKGYMDFGGKLAPNPPHEDYVPWYMIPTRETNNVRVVFSGENEEVSVIPNVYPLQSGNGKDSLPGVIKLSAI